MPSIVVTLGAVGLDGEHRAALHGLAVDVDGAGAALARVAADVGAGELEVLAEDLDEQPSRLDIPLPGLSVDDERDVLGHDWSLLPEPDWRAVAGSQPAGRRLMGRVGGQIRRGATSRVRVRPGLPGILRRSRPSCNLVSLSGICGAMPRFSRGAASAIQRGATSVERGPEAVDHRVDLVLGDHERRRDLEGVAAEDAAWRRRGCRAAATDLVGRPGSAASRSGCERDGRGQPDGPDLADAAAPSRAGGPRASSTGSSVATRSTRSSRSRMSRLAIAAAAAPAWPEYV